MATFKFLLQEPYLKQTEKEKEEKKPKKLNPDETRLYCFMILDRDHIIKIKTEHVIYPTEWDFRNQLKKEIKGNAPGTPEANKAIQEFNKELRKLRDDISDQYQKIKKAHPDMLFEQVSQSLKEYGKTKEIPFLDIGNDLFQVLDKYIEKLRSIQTEGTVKKYVSLKNNLVEFGKSKKKYEHLTFSMIDHNFLDDYRIFLRSMPARGRQKNRPEDDQNGLLLATQGKYIECLKSFCKWAEDRDYNKYTSYKEFATIPIADTKRKKSDYEIVVLTLPELRKLYNHKFESHQDHYDRVRDLFCFGVFTGQRWGDFTKFDKSQLKDDVWIFNSEKTKKETKIYLTGFAATALDILKKYDYKLPQISGQKFNKYIKESAAAAGINEETKIIRYVNANNEIVIKGPKSGFLSSHSGRRTCVSILLNNYNLNPTHVMGITQHSDLKTLQKYIKKDDEARKDAMSKTKGINETMKVVKRKAV